MEALQDNIISFRSLKKNDQKIETMIVLTLPLQMRTIQIAQNNLEEAITLLNNKHYSIEQKKEIIEIAFKSIGIATLLGGEAQAFEMLEKVVATHFFLGRAGPQKINVIKKAMVHIPQAEKSGVYRKLKRMRNDILEAN